MIKFDEKEINWAVRKFERIVRDIDNIDSIEDEDYKDYLDGIDTETYDNMLKVIESDFDKINSNEDINEAFIEGLIWGVGGMWVWLDNRDSVEFVRELLGNVVDEEYFTLYEKILNKFEFESEDGEDGEEDV
ncbi:hypothetical protein [Clostridium formicaceticum]|uniref:Uncharacterized protein n=1 Tax=Clostridium formicaceticum TaxID=1497 RepID=A0AAC9RHY6_9CLOT|nr:hypothetical protein [Clostridium formicaceticum]AOY76901.1 hypothetical protein BJL90_14185 [Clostridium formicaceticum]ARE87381.1 hypothetical protein CLFO_17810 [Clostridium formicaceticum]